MEKTIRFLKCDECGKDQAYQLEPALCGGRPPFEHWIKNVNNELDFCSPKCAENYFAHWDEK